MSIDYRDLEKMWNSLSDVKSNRHRHTMEVSVDDGVYHGHCPECGMSGATDRAGAIYLGWIQEAVDGGC